MRFSRPILSALPSVARQTMMKLFISTNNPSRPYTDWPAAAAAAIIMTSTFASLEKENNLHVFPMSSFLVRDSTGHVRSFPGGCWWNLAWFFTLFRIYIGRNRDYCAYGGRFTITHNVNFVVFYFIAHFTVFLMDDDDCSNPLAVAGLELCLCGWCPFVSTVRSLCRSFGNDDESLRCSATSKYWWWQTKRWRWWWWQTKRQKCYSKKKNPE